MDKEAAFYESFWLLVFCDPFRLPWGFGRSPAASCLAVYPSRRYCSHVVVACPLGTGFLLFQEGYALGVDAFAERIPVEEQRKSMRVRQCMIQYSLKVHIIDCLVSGLLYHVILSKERCICPRAICCNDDCVLRTFGRSGTALTMSYGSVGSLSRTKRAW